MIVFTYDLMYMHWCFCVLACAHECVRVSVCALVFTQNLYVGMRVRTRALIRMSFHEYTYVCYGVCLNVSVYIYVCVSAHVYMLMFVCCGTYACGLWCR